MQAMGPVRAVRPALPQVVTSAARRLPPECEGTAILRRVLTTTRAHERCLFSTPCSSRVSHEEPTSRPRPRARAACPRTPRSTVPRPRLSRVGDWRCGRSRPRARRPAPGAGRERSGARTQGRDITVHRETTRRRRIRVAEGLRSLRGVRRRRRDRGPLHPQPTRPSRGWNNAPRVGTTNAPCNLCAAEVTTCGCAG